ncbi:hypothetical protein ARNL5_02982 [Anaerolineae bacterium]|nr:hypothetical protein ARNL5_02982 [Anaerolineae bacterium]
MEVRASPNRDSMNRIDPAALGDLCPELRSLLEAELAAGNRVTDADRGCFSPDAVFVLLERPFTREPTLPEGVVRVEVNDPHWWRVEYRHTVTGHVIACRFG